RFAVSVDGKSLFHSLPKLRRRFFRLASVPLTPFLGPALALPLSETRQACITPLPSRKVTLRMWTPNQSNRLAPKRFGDHAPPSFYSWCGGNSRLACRVAGLRSLAGRLEVHRQHGDDLRHRTAR